MLLIVTDAPSKWPEVQVTTTTTASKTIEVLREMFARYGYLVSDNGPQFVSAEFGNFCASNGIIHLRSAPYHPATNGAVECMVQTVRQATKAGQQRGISLDQALSTFLLRYRATPHATTGVSPSDLFLGRSLRTKLDLLRSSVSRHVQLQQSRQKIYHDWHCQERSFAVGQHVWAHVLFVKSRTCSWQQLYVSL